MSDSECFYVGRPTLEARAAQFGVAQRVSTDG